MNRNMAGLPERVALLYSDAKREYFPTEQQYISEAEVKDRAKMIAGFLERMGIETRLLAGDDGLSEELKSYSPDLVINLVDSIHGKEYLSAAVPGMLELLKVPYTGTGMLGQAINSNKYLTKNLLEQYGITTPKYQLLKSVGDEVDEVLDFPLITKLNEIHGSIEIDDSAVCETEQELSKRVKFLMETYQQPVLVEEYIAGREVTVVVFEGMNTKVYSAEKVFNLTDERKYTIIGFDDNWKEGESVFGYVKYELPDRVKQAVKEAFSVLKMEDYAKFDLRVDGSGRHYFIDCNTNPTLGPDNVAAIGSIMKMYGIDFEEVLLRLIRNTLQDSRG